MFHDLHKSFDSNLSRFYDWERLAKSETNPHRRDDLISAAIIAGKLEMIACILSHEWDDTSRKAEAEAAAASVREIAETI
jgi:hypothetical protein